MPFKKIYEVNFSNGNLSPQINTYQWPPMHFMASDNALVEQIHEPHGWNLKITRGPNVSPEVKNSLVVSLTDPLSISSRIYTRVFFDLPQVGRIASGTSFPEPWAVALLISNKDHLLDSNASAVVSCQFHRKDNQSGVRLNASLALQTDQSYYLESPLDYQQYQAGSSPNVNVHEPGHDPHTIHPGPAPLFLLEHSFCGLDMANQKHFPGCGFLTIQRTMNNEVKTHRVYSAKNFPTSTIVSTNPMDTNAIRALGVNLSTLNGRGWMSIRLRSFEAWMDIDQPYIVS